MNESVELQLTWNREEKETFRYQYLGERVRKN